MRDVEGHRHDHAGAIFDASRKFSGNGSVAVFSKRPGERAVRVEVSAGGRQLDRNTGVRCGEDHGLVGPDDDQVKPVVADQGVVQLLHHALEIALRLQFLQRMAGQLHLARQHLHVLLLEVRLD